MGYCDSYTNIKVLKTKKTVIVKGKLSGYKHFCNEMRPISKKQFNNHKPSQMLSILGTEWRKLSKSEQKNWCDKALQIAEDTAGNRGNIDD